jgi:hypothetical protein
VSAEIAPPPDAFVTVAPVWPRAGIATAATKATTPATIARRFMPQPSLPRSA